MTSRFARRSARLEWSDAKVAWIDFEEGDEIEVWGLRYGAWVFITHRFLSTRTCLGSRRQRMSRLRKTLIRTMPDEWMRPWSRSTGLRAAIWLVRMGTV